MLSEDVHESRLPSESWEYVDTRYESELGEFHSVTGFFRAVSGPSPVGATVGYVTGPNFIGKFRCSADEPTAMLIDPEHNFEMVVELLQEERCVRGRIAVRGKDESQHWVTLYSWSPGNDTLR